MSNSSSRFIDHIPSTTWNDLCRTQLSSVSIENFFPSLADSSVTILIYSKLYSLYFLIFNGVLYCNHSWNLQIMLPQLIIQMCYLDLILLKWFHLYQWLTVISEYYLAFPITNQDSCLLPVPASSARFPSGIVTGSIRVRHAAFF